MFHIAQTSLCYRYHQASCTGCLIRNEVREVVGTLVLAGCPKGGLGITENSCFWLSLTFAGALGLVLLSS